MGKLKQTTTDANEENYPEYPEYPEYAENEAICSTIRGPRPDKPCVFPFIFNGETKTTCIKGHLRPEPWCATKVNNANEYIRGEWGICNNSCFNSDKVDCSWSTWSSWTSCSKTCGHGVKERTRQVLTPAQNRGSPCQGLSRQTQSCNDQGCQDCCDTIEIYSIGSLEYKYSSVYGHYIKQKDLINGRPWYKNDGIGRSIWWAESDSWNLEDTSKKGNKAADAVLYNNGTCIPNILHQEWKSFNGFQFNEAGNSIKARCSTKPIVNCQWNSWGSWQSCSVSCGGGTSKRNRNKSIVAQNGGLDCPGDHQESQNCNTNLCPPKCANPSWIGDNECDATNNNALCDFDGGDCIDKEIDCRKGDGIGGSEKILSGKFTVQECITEVKNQHPKANGASMNFDCPNNCSCWAEFDMDRWEGTSYQACIFKKKAPSLKTCIQHNVDFQGDDVDAGLGIYKSSQNECQKACQYHTLCQYWTFTLKNWASNCYLKKAASNPVSNAMFVSGSKYCL